MKLCSCIICGKSWVLGSHIDCVECMQKEAERELDWIEKVVGKKPLSFKVSFQKYKED